MGSYKIIKDDKVISVIDSPVWVTQLSNGAIVRSALGNAMGLISPDGSQTWHIAGTRHISQAGRTFDDVEAVYIEASEAAELRTLLDLGASVDSSNEAEWVEDPITESAPTPVDNATLAEVRARKLDVMLNESRQVIYDGVDVELSDGHTEHFALGIDEQLDLITLFSLASIGQEQIPFHNANGECAYYSSNEIMSIINAANKLKMYHAAYMDSLKKWISNMSDIAQIGNVRYGDAVPEAYHTELYRDLSSGV